MKPGVTIWCCAGCGAAYFPQPLLCSKCHGGVFETDRVHEAVVEEVSVIRHMIGQESWQPRRIASVLTTAGPRITIGLRDASEPGTAVELFEDGTAPVGKAKT